MRTLPPLNMLRVFEEVARHRSFNRAGLALNVTQGAVSRQIRQLEDYLGVQLIVRSPRGLTLTESGLVLAGQLGEALDRIERVVEVMRVPNLRQRLRILAPPTWATRWLSPRLRLFMQRCPDINLSVTNQHNEENPGDLDLRILFSHQDNAHGQQRLLVMERHIAVASPDLFVNGAAPLLHDHPLLHVLHTGRRLQVWENWLAATGQHGIDATSGVEFSTLDQVINAALAGAGLAVIDRQMIERELASGSLLPISPVEVSGPYGYWLDIPADKRGLAKVERFQDWLMLTSNP
ncbi:LysR substrate-binding domain-containing protein [Pseudomonas sp. zjy_14]|uniref:LysR substrate-binding domain-containing protein n=1 Tax=Pseudomonas sp. zjy_14 TaxID=3367264 RepID=UPI00370BEB08